LEDHPTREVTDLSISLAVAALRSCERPFKVWLGQSKATKSDGTPAVLYRGEHGVRPEGVHLQSCLNSLSFTDDRDAANTYATSPNNSRLDNVAETPRVTPVHLKIENPVIENRNDPFVELSHLVDKLGLTEGKRIALKFDADIRYTGNWNDKYEGKYDNVAQLLKERSDEIKNLYFNAHKLLDDPVEVERLKKAGYDGAIHIGNGETATALEYRVFNPNQVRSAISGHSIFWHSAGPGPASGGRGPF
jgi:hypothetical protein